MKAKIKQIEIDVIKQAIEKSKSLASVCKMLECTDNSNNRDYLKQIISKYSINTDHFNITNKPINRELYENNPKVCKLCGEIIPYERRENEFCSKSCAATFNNTKRNIDTSKLATISDEIFINAINTSKGWKQILNNLGYSEKANTKIKQKIQDRCILLNLKLNLEKTIKQIDWSTRTKKQLFEERSTWQSARTAIRRMAQEIYAKSDKEYKCAVCGYNKHIEIAHIKAVSDFDDSATITEINDINNLIGLCPNHHWEYDNGLLDIQKYIK